ncbi:MAG: hypothetical protein RQ866_05985 [Bacteroidales bacterium]|nr:hypothetical protein [Bacteroidales bacterium]
MIKTIIALLLFFFLINSTKSHAQDDTLTALPHHHTIIKFSPTGLLELPTTAIQFGIEYPLKRYTPWTMQHDIAFIPGYEGPFFWDDIYHKYGWRVRTEVKYYIPEAYNKISREEPYMSLEAFYRSRTFLEKRWRSVANGAFWKYMEYDLLKNTGGIHFKYGRLKQINNNIIFDYFIGFGFRFLQKKADFGDNVDVDTEGSSNDGYFYFIPSATIGFKIGYGF